MGYGEVARETATEAHERRVQAITAVLAKWYSGVSPPSELRRLAKSILAAVEAGF
jgi:hypothetical protein